MITVAHSSGRCGSPLGTRPAANRIQVSPSSAGVLPARSSYALVRASDTAATASGNNGASVRAERALQVVAVDDQLEQPGQQVVLTRDRAAPGLEDLAGNRVQGRERLGRCTPEPADQIVAEGRRDLAGHPRDLVGGRWVRADVLAQ